MVRITVGNIEEFRGEVTVAQGDLAFDVWQVFDRMYFEGTPNCMMVELSRLISTKDQLQDPQFRGGKKRDPRETAYLRMLDAAVGRIAPRPPITVIAEQDGRLRIIDGNATAQVLMLAGWAQVPVEVRHDASREGTVSAPTSPP